jgi:hypothetical protein
MSNTHPCEYCKTEIDYDKTDTCPKCEVNIFAEPKDLSEDQKKKLESYKRLDMLMEKHQPNDCSCDRCKSCCLVSPCLGTPEDMEKLEKAGHMNDVSKTYVLDGKTNTFKEVKALKGIAWNHNGHQLMKCSMLDDNGLCKLHNKGLKPTEGRIINHTCSHQDTVDIRHELLKEWDSKPISMIEMLAKVTNG